MIKHLVILITASCCFALMISCASTTGSQTQSSGGYSEDLSLYRPLYPEPKLDSINYDVVEVEEVEFVEPQMAITEELDSLLDSISAYSRSRGFYPVFTIQIYNGTSSQEANEAKRLAYREFPDEIPVLEYIQPIFRVKVGRFLERIDANWMLSEVRKVFPNATLIPERVYH